MYGPERFAAHSLAIGARPDRRDFPAHAPCPVLIVGALDDQVVPTNEQRRWAEADRAIAFGDATGGPGAGQVTHVEIPETGHMLPVDTPDQLASVISDWLRAL